MLEVLSKLNIDDFPSTLSLKPEKISPFPVVRLYPNIVRVLLPVSLLPKILGKPLPVNRLFDFRSMLGASLLLFWAYLAEEKVPIPLKSPTPALPLENKFLKTDVVGFYESLFCLGVSFWGTSLGTSLCTSLVLSFLTETMLRGESFTFGRTCLRRRWGWGWGYRRIRGFFRRYFLELVV